MFPTGNTTRHGDDVRACDWHIRETTLPKGSGIQRRRRPTARIEAVELSGPGFVNDREQVATHAALHWRDDAHAGICRDGGINGVAALRKNLRGGLGSKRMFGGDD